MLHIPAKYKRTGLKVKCLSCRWQVTGKECHRTGKGIATCPHKDKHRFNIIVCIPKHYGRRRTKILPEGTTLDTALHEVNKFRKELELYNYRPATKQSNASDTIIQLAVQYLDALAGINTPDFLCRKRSVGYQDETRLAIERFIKSLKEKDYPIHIMRLDELTDNELGIYHDFLKKLGIQARTYNKHIALMKAFVNWAIRTRDKKVINIFTHIQLRAPQRESAIILKEEFESLIKAIEPSMHWLKNAYRLALETGVRREELVTIRWSDIIEISPGVSVLKLNNLKVNRIESGLDEGKCKYIPLTKSLKGLLLEMGYAEKRSTDMPVLNYPGTCSKDYLMNVLTRSFSHYIKMVTNRKLEFKCLRKTYLTHLTLALGEKAKIFSGHSDDAVLRNHYLNKAYLVGNMGSFSIF